MGALVEAAIRTRIQQMNPWLGDPRAASREARRRMPSELVARAESTRVDAVLDDARHAHLVIGPRQAGKSTLIWHAIARRPTELLYLDCDDSLVRAWCEAPTAFGHDLPDWLGPGGLVFLEEAQSLSEAGLFVKGLVDLHLGRRIVVTGSASFHWLAKTRESLAGRASYHHLWPLALGEVAPRGGRLAAAHQRDASAAAARMLVWGGYPEVWTSDEPRAVLDRLVTAFVLRDASDRFRIERPDAMRLLLRLAAGQIGDLVNLSEWASLTRVSAGTVSEYASILEETHVLRRVRPFVGGKRAELTQMPKVFFLDNGLRNAVAGGFTDLEARADIGKLMENFVFSELHKRWPEPGGVRFWRTRNGAEVDFVVEPRAGELIGVEAKARADARHRLPRAARSFIEAYQPSRFMIVHRGEAHETQLGDTEVEWVPLALLAQALDAIARGS